MKTKEVGEGQDVGRPFQNEFLALQKIIASMKSTSGLKEVLEQISTAIVQVLGYDNSVIALLDRDKATFKPAAININLGKGLMARLEEMVGKRLIDFEIPADRDYNEAMRALLDGEVVITHHLSDLLSPPLNRFLCFAMQQQAKVKALAIIPLSGREGVVGSIMVTTPREEITETELQTLVTFAEQAGIAVEEASLQEEVKREAAEKRKAEQRVGEESAKLRESRAFVESVFSTIADPIVVTNVDGVVIAVNRATTELLGYQEDELIGHNYLDVYILPEERSHSGDRHSKVATEGVNLVFERVWQSKDGEEIPMAMHNAPLRDGKGNIIGVISAARDMRRMRGLIADLETSKAFIESVFSAIADPVVVVNPDRVIIAANKAMIELLGYREDELIGHNYIDVYIPPQKRPLSGKRTDKIIAEGTPLIYEGTWQNKRGEEIPVELNGAPLRDSKGAIIGVINVARDMRQMKGLIAELERSKAFIESIFQTVADPIVVTNTDRIIVAVNKAMTELFGYQEDELVGHNYIDVIIPPERRYLSGKTHSEVMAKGVPIVFERTWQTKNGEEIPVAVHDATLRDDKGEIIGVIAAARDMRQTKSLIAELERSRAFIESIFRTIADPVVVANPDKVIIAVNEATIELLGYGEYELIGHNYIDVIIPPERRYLSGKTHDEVVTKGVTLIVERIWQTKDGERIPMAIHDAPLLAASGEIIGSIAVGRDMRQMKGLITELEQSRGELAHSEERYRDLVENINDSYCVIQGGNIVFVNKTAAEMLGYDIEEAIGEPFVKFIAPECLSEVQERYEKRMRGEAVLPQYEMLLLKKDGTRLPVELSVRVAPYQDALADHVLLRDISERKRLEQEKAEAWERYRAILENAPDPIIVTDADNIVQFWNRYAEEHSGYKAEEVVGKSPAVVVPPDLYQEARWLTKEALNKGRVDKYETERVLKDGRRVPVEITIAPLRDASGNLQGFIIISRDISEKKRLEQEKAEAQERMIRAEKLASIGQVGSSVAHELRQPLSVINNAVYFLRMQLPDVEGKVKKHLGILEREVASAEKIISELLDLGRPRKLHLEPAEVNPIIEQALSRAQLPQRVEVSTELKKLPPMMVDAEQLGRVFLNIILNAAQAMPDGGHLDVTSDREDNSVVVRFRDSGSGIAAEDMDMLFEPMFTTKARGVGLGLTICKSIIEALQGTIGIQSELGHGTTVTIKLPITKQGEDND